MLAVILLLGLISGCKKVEKQAARLTEELKQAERVEDQVLVRALENAAAGALIDGVSDRNLWAYMRGNLDDDSVRYLENLREDDYSDGALDVSMHDGGWIRVKQGWIIISKMDHVAFSYSDQQP